jgi:hypothetical protein
MSIRGKWRIVEMPDHETDYPDMMGPAEADFIAKPWLTSSIAC